MRGIAKGQSNILVATILLILAIPLSQIPNAAIEGILTSSFNDMEKNSMRYKSMAHSYKFVSEDVNNRVNYSEVETSLTPISINDRCTSNLYNPDDYNVSFDDVVSGSTFSSKDCTGGVEYVTIQYELLHPAMPFYEVKSGDRVSISTVVDWGG